MKKFATCIGFLLYATLFSELFLRVFSPQAILPRYVIDGGDGIRQNMPNVSYNQITPEVNISVSINDRGIRSPKTFSEQKKEGQYRVILLGDSFLMGYEVEFEDSLASLLEADLKSKGVNAEIINLSVSGFGTAEHMIALEARGLKYEPDLVVMEWHHSDMADNVRAKLFGFNEVGELVRARDSYLPGVAIQKSLLAYPGYKWISENSHLYSAIREKIATFTKRFLVKWQSFRNFDLYRLISDKTMGSTRQGSEGGSGDRRVVIDTSDRELDIALINRVRELSVKSGAEFLLLDVPRSISRTQLQSSFDFLPKAFLKDIETVSPYNALEEQLDGRRLLYFEKGHGHWTPQGNRVVNSILAPVVLDMAIKKSKAGS